MDQIELRSAKQRKIRDCCVPRLHRDPSPHPGLNVALLQSDCRYFINETWLRNVKLQMTHGIKI